MITIEQIHVALTSQPTEFWTTASTNLIILLTGGTLSVISYLAYQREQKRSFQIAALGFVLLTLGNLTIVIYQTFVAGSYFLGGIELLRIQSIGGGIAAFGLLILLYSLYRF